MIRKSIIVLLALAAVGTCVFWVATYWWTLETEESFVRPSVTIARGVIEVRPPHHPVLEPVRPGAFRPERRPKVFKIASDGTWSFIDAPIFTPCGPLKSIVSISGLSISYSACSIHTNTRNRLSVRATLAIPLILFAVDPGSVVHPDDRPPEPPDWLDEVAKAEWDRVVSNLVAWQVVGRGDSSILANYCMAVSACEAAHRDIAKHGLTAVTDAGREYKRPIVSILDESRTAMLRLAGELGLTVVARTRIGNGAPAARQKSELQAFIDKDLKLS